MLTDPELDALLRAAIAASGLNRFQLAKRCGCSYSLIHGFCAGTKTMQLDTASRVLDALGYIAELKPKRKG